jgi:hypothetical protein
MDVEGWFFETDHERMGPISLAELQWLVSVGILHRDTRVWADGMDEPARAEALPMLFGAPGPTVRGRAGWAVLGYLCIALLVFALALSLIYSVRQLVGYAS